MGRLVHTCGRPRDGGTSGGDAGAIAVTSELDGDAANDVDEGHGEEVAGDGAHHGDDGVAGGGLVDLLIDGLGAAARARRGVVDIDFLRSAAGKLSGRFGLVDIKSYNSTWTHY